MHQTGFDAGCLATRRPTTKSRKGLLCTLHSTATSSGSTVVPFKRRRQSFGWQARSWVYTLPGRGTAVFDHNPCHNNQLLPWITYHSQTIVLLFFFLCQVNRRSCSSGMSGSQEALGIHGAAWVVDWQSIWIHLHLLAQEPVQDFCDRPARWVRATGWSRTLPGPEPAAWVPTSRATSAIRPVRHAVPFWRHVRDSPQGPKRQPTDAWSEDCTPIPGGESSRCLEEGFGPPALRAARLQPFPTSWALSGVGPRISPSWLPDEGVGNWSSGKACCIVRAWLAPLACHHGDFKP